MMSGESGTSAEGETMQLKWVFGVVGLAAGLVLGMALGVGIAGGDGEAAPVDTGEIAFSPSPDFSPEFSPSPEETEEESGIPDPQADYTVSCDYVLGDFSEETSHGYRFVAGANIENTGNVGIVIEVVARFVQLGTKPIEISKEVEIGEGKSRSVNMTEPVGYNEISLIQAAQDAGEYCTVKATITDYFA